MLYVWALRHPASGYVQGINDLATPFYAVFLEPYAGLDATTVTASDDELFAVEADVYWCLTRILDGMMVRCIQRGTGSSNGSHVDEVACDGIIG